MLLVALSAGGCGNTLYALEVREAAAKLAAARELGAERLATYEYYMATEHLAKARAEAAEADYSDALELSRAAHAHAERAIRGSRAAQPERPR